MTYWRGITLFTLFIFLMALGGDNFAQTTTSPDAPSSTAIPSPATLSPIPNADKMTMPSDQTTQPNKAPTQATTPVDTRPVVAKVIWTKGSFNAENPDKVKRALNKNDAIYLHDRLLTDKDSQAQIVFSDDTLMTFKPETNFYIEKYDYHPDAKKKSVGSYIMNLITGGFRTITGLIAKANPSDYKVNTPVATIGVRGTDYTVLYQGGVLIMGYDHGMPCVTNAGGGMCLGGDKRYLQVNSASNKPINIKQPPAEFLSPVVIQPVSYSPPTGVVSTSGPKGAAQPKSEQGSFCIK